MYDLYLYFSFSFRTKQTHTGDVSCFVTPFSYALHEVVKKIYICMIMFKISSTKVFIFILKCSSQPQKIPRYTTFPQGKIRCDLLNCCKLFTVHHFITMKLVLIFFRFIKCNLRTRFNVWPNTSK